MQDRPEFPVQVLFDGSCSICAAEMNIYRSRDHGGRLVFVDISSPKFDPAPYGISLKECRDVMHCIDGNGRIYRGVEAFRVIWLAFPASIWYALLAALVGLPGVNFLAGLVYRVVARMR
jgi:predicted DCC family thiol-disulfide oxidoreductase YuxK